MPQAKKRGKSKAPCGRYKSGPKKGRAKPCGSKKGRRRYSPCKVLAKCGKDAEKCAKAATACEKLQANIKKANAAAKEARLRKSGWDPNEAYWPSQTDGLGRVGRRRRRRVRRRR